MRVLGAGSFLIALLLAGVYLWHNWFKEGSLKGIAREAGPRSATTVRHAREAAQPPPIAIKAPVQPSHPRREPKARNSPVELAYAREIASLKKPDPFSAVAMETRRFRRPMPIDAGSLVSGDTRIKIAGIEALRQESTCTLPIGEIWPCGKMATFALRRLVRGRSIVCEIEQELDPATVSARCTVARIDIGQWLVRRGWAHPVAGSDDLSEALASARREKVGQWRDALPTID